MTIATEQLRRQLDAGLAALQLDLPASARERLLVYVGLLHKWNRAYNLTAVRVPAEMVSRHLLDSLAVLPHLRGSRFADVGTGAGLPGIPLAIARPDAQFDLFDSNGKKVRFLIQAIAGLGLTNVTARQVRIEQVRPAVGYDGVLSRAFASLQDMVGCTAQLLAPEGRFFAMKGLWPADELAALPDGYTVEAGHRLQVPGEIAERHLVILQRAEAGHDRAG
ncbi:MAG: 16S rRNA (guanine(527)-N(7))-methyltransferase RsmG [Spongiibacteraceae bacterium]|nr:16S rRNA (guanine(527)-N(7))-methyltransferase RsmG [Spongiibacteraceae bacterium]